ncbi:MAG: hypothetical protein K0S08_2162 [Gammaproteobacteria bacterium]|jgi:hypothetical protein|nr:hypothetical protein [Gammaproteobacteria bacterium]
MPRFLNVPERRTCRYDSRYTSEEIIGLYTDAFSECNVIILFNQDKDGTRISMTHADRLVYPSQIAAEIQWIGEGFKAIVVAKNGESAAEIRQQALGPLLQKCSLQYCATETFAISFDIQGTLNTYTRENLPLLATHPQEWQFQSNFILNLLLTTYEPVITGRRESLFKYAQPNYAELKNTSLLFDGTMWQPLAQHDVKLVPLAADFLAFMKRELEQQKIFSKTAALGGVRMFLAQRNIPPSLIHTSDQLLMLTHSLLLVTGNNYQKIFNDELQFILRQMFQLRADKGELAFMCDLIKATQDNFEKFSGFFAHVKKLQTPELASCLTGIYKLCTRLKQHDAGMQDTAQQVKLSAVAAPI